MSAFSYFDKDGSGYITLDEIQQACKDFGLDDIHIDDMIKEIDQDNVSNILCLVIVSFLVMRHKIIKFHLVMSPSVSNFLLGVLMEGLWCRMGK